MTTFQIFEVTFDKDSMVGIHTSRNYVQKKSMVKCGN